MPSKVIGKSRIYLGPDGLLYTDIPPSIASALGVQNGNEAVWYLNPQNRTALFSPPSRILSKQQQAVYQAILNLGVTSTTGKIQREYRILTSHNDLPKLTTRRVRGIIEELEEMGLITTEVTSFGRYGRTKVIKEIKKQE